MSCVQDVISEDRGRWLQVGVGTGRFASALGILCEVTPQFFVMNRERILVYRGAWDDNLNASKVTSRFVDEVVAALLAGQTPAVQEANPRGCLIDYR